VSFQIRYWYRLLVVDVTALNVSGTGSIARTRMSSGSAWFTARRSPSTGICVMWVSKWATCPFACTPASVRELPASVTGWRTTDVIARSSSSCTVGMPAPSAIASPL
jgi:hypothetical protein